MDWYILNPDKTTRKAATTEEQLEALAGMEGRAKVVAQEFIGDVWVSTVFVGLDHSLGGDVPILFETIIKQNDEWGETWRYATWQEAEAGHRRVCSEVTSGLSKEQLEAAKAVIEPLLEQRPVNECDASEEAEKRVDNDNRQDDYKNDIDDFTNRGREWE